MSVSVVTGFAPIPNHPRSLAEYKELGERLRKMDLPLYAYIMPLEKCWLYTYLDWTGCKPTHSVSDNPKKNTLAYHIVQHQKTEFLLDVALRTGAKTDTWVWIDYGIFSVPGVTEDIIYDFVKRVDGEQAITIPGCWQRAFVDPNRYNEHPNWRFCGGVWIVPRQYLFQLDASMKLSVMYDLAMTNHLSWEVNTLAKVEATDRLPIWWYEADHNEKIFTNYKRGTSDARENSNRICSS